VHDDHGCLVGDRGDGRPDGLGTRCASRHGAVDLSRADFLRNEDRRLLPLGRSCDDDSVDPVRRVQALDAGREQGPTAEWRKGFRPVDPEPLAAARSG
jgi:hypothetical protein